MKKTAALLLCLLLASLLCSCSLDYSELGEEGPFSYACGKRSAFLTEYRWDGTEDGKIIRVPETVGGLPVAAVGGYFGRGLPMPFHVDLSAALGENVQSGTDEAEADITVTLDFTLLLPDSIETDDVLWLEEAPVLRITEEDGTCVEYRTQLHLQHGS